MEWSERMNAAIGYIEDSLADELNFSEAAKKACCSLFHFQRMFFATTGVTPAEYVRRRRLTLAARELTSTNAKVIDIGLKYGYDSPDSFARAFRNVHGITPQAAREPGVKLAAFPRISFSIILSGGIDMDYRIMEKPSFKVAGLIRKFTADVQQNMQQISQWWQEYGPSPEHGKLRGFKGGKPGAITGGIELGICFQKEGSDVWYYAIAVELPKGKSPKPYEILDVPASTWGIFETTLDEISKCWLQIFQEWFPSTGYEHSGTPEMEVYLPGDMSNPNTVCQIWIPVVDKKKKK